MGSLVHARRARPVFGRWLLPDRRPAISDQDDPRRYTVEMIVEPGSPLVGRTVEQAGLRHLSGVYLVMTNNAAAVLVFPIALAAAERLGVSPMPFAMAIMMAASCGFATPIGYQTNLMVYGPGGYRFGDYVRFGGPLNLLVWATTLVVGPLVWPF